MVFWAQIDNFLVKIPPIGNKIEAPMEKATEHAISLALRSRLEAQLRQLEEGRVQ